MRGQDVTDVAGESPPSDIHEESMPGHGVLPCRSVPWRSTTPLQPHVVYPVRDDTARGARTAVANGSGSLRLRDFLGQIDN